MTTPIQIVQEHFWALWWLVLLVAIVYCENRHK
jgi:hypothetical protein